MLRVDPQAAHREVAFLQQWLHQHLGVYERQPAAPSATGGSGPDRRG